MAFRSVNLNAPRGPRGGGGGRGGNYRGSSSGYSTPPLRIDASGRVDQGFGPVGGVAAAADPDFDIFGIDDPSTFQTQQSAPVQSILYVPLVFFQFIFGRSLRSMEYYVLPTVVLILNVPYVLCVLVNVSSDVM
jgi:hypothetical protein